VAHKHTSYQNSRAELKVCLHQPASRVLHTWKDGVEVFKGMGTRVNCGTAEEVRPI